MNLSFLEELRDLDPRDPGRWPLAAMAGAVGATFLVLTLFLIYFFVWQDVRPELQQKATEEQSLRQEFQQKHARAVNLAVYKQQLKDLQRSFGALLRQLP
ncbi:MAG: type 4a pilus biogenesis protein PilO, partial [Steroidobacteraceae bacterium]